MSCMRGRSAELQAAASSARPSLTARWNSTNSGASRAAIPLCHAAGGYSSTISWSRLTPWTVPGSACWANSSWREWNSRPELAVSLNATTVSSQDSSAASSTGYVNPVVEGLL